MAARLSALAASGNDIGGKTLDGTPLTTLSTSQQISEMCNGRQNIISHGITPYTFAYPGGAYNTTIESEVQNCGYGNARTAGSLSPSGSTYAETLPPKNWLATGSSRTSSRGSEAINGASTRWPNDAVKIATGDSPATKTYTTTVSIAPASNRN